MSVCAHFGPISHTNSATNNKQTKLATAIGNSRMPFANTLANDQRSQADGVEEDDEEGKGEEFAYGQCVCECNIHHSHTHTLTDTDASILVAIFMRCSIADAFNVFLQHLPLFIIVSSI